MGRNEEVESVNRFYGLAMDRVEKMHTAAGLLRDTDTALGRCTVCICDEARINDPLAKPLLRWSGSGSGRNKLTGEKRRGAALK